MNNKTWILHILQQYIQYSIYYILRYYELLLSMILHFLWCFHGLSFGFLKFFRSAPNPCSSQPSIIITWFWWKAGSITHQCPAPFFCIHMKCCHFRSIDHKSEMAHQIGLPAWDLRWGDPKSPMLFLLMPSFCWDILQSLVSLQCMNYATLMPILTRMEM